MVTSPPLAGGILRPNGWVPDMRWQLAIFALVLDLTCHVACWGDIFVLRDGGRVEGVLLNPEEAKSAGYRVRPLDGGIVTIPADDITKVIPWSKAKTQYVTFLPDMPPTAEGHWKMAEWCLTAKLPDEREFHLEEVIRLEPGHAKARKALGYVQVDGSWILPEEIMRQRGFVRYEGRWRLPIDVERMEAAKKTEAQIAEWKSKVRLWRKWIGGKQHLEAIENLESISDPLAVPAIVDLLKKDDSTAMLRLAIGLLGKIGTADAVMVLSTVVMDSPDDDLRDYAVEQLERFANPDLTFFFVKQLKSKDNVRVQRAAYALGHLKDPEAIKPLIDSLITQHQSMEAPANPNQISSAFGSGAGQSGTGFSTGGGRPKVVNHLIQNRTVLDALTGLTGVNFQYDQAAWKAWLIHERTKDIPVNLRRGM
jgi:HEAT repeats/PBS lyase HEAT-like repeat